MSQWKAVDEVLDFAIDREQEAHDFYVDLARKVDMPWMKATFEEFAKEEAGHKAKIQGLKQGKKLQTSEKKVLDLKIGDYLVDVTPSENMDYQDALVLAMQREKAAFRLYSDLARQSIDDSVRTLFLGLAQEEARHKLRFEVEYDDRVLKEN
ncbi:MAG: ferritin family protein [Pseudomonadota bacterium]